MMNTSSKSIFKNISKIVLATSLLLSTSVMADDKIDVKVLTATMVEQSTQQVNQQLAQQLNADIQFSLTSKLPLVLGKSSQFEVLLAKAELKNVSRNKNRTHSE